MIKKLSLRDNDITLINIDERNMKSRDFSEYLSKIKFKDIVNIHIKLLIKLNNSDQVIGYILSYKHNKTDGHIRIDCEMEEEYINDYLEKAVNLFCNYLYICFPIRKIYFETCNKLEDNIIRVFQKMKFEQEACLKEDTFYNNEYLDRYIFTMDVNQFFREEE